MCTFIFKYFKSFFYQFEKNEFRKLLLPLLISLKDIIPDFNLVILEKAIIHFKYIYKRIWGRYGKSYRKSTGIYDQNTLDEILK